MADLPRTGIQGLHTLPQKIWDDLKSIFEINLPKRRKGDASLLAR
jgi:hypothetical protein